MRSLPIVLLIIHLALTAAAAQTQTPAPGFWGDVTGSVVSTAPDGATLTLTVELATPDKKRNKLADTDSLVGKPITLSRSYNLGKDAQTRWIKSLRPGERVWGRAYWNDKYNTFFLEAQHRLTPTDAEKGGVVFLGDSIFAWWAGQADAFAGIKTANRAVPGDSTGGIAQQLDVRLLQLEPKAVVLLIGTNDLLSFNDQQVAEKIRTLVDQIHEKRPKLPVVLLQVMPQDPARVPPAKVKATNDRLAALAKDRPGVVLVDSYSTFAVADGSFDKTYFADRVHPSEAGYARLAKLLGPVVRAIDDGDLPGARAAADASADALGRVAVTPATPKPEAPAPARPAAAGDVTYRETFASAGDALSDYGWTIFINNDAREIAKQQAWGGATGSGGEAPAVNSNGRKSVEPWKGFVWIAPGNRYLLMTTEAAFARPVQSIAWHQALKSDDRVHVVVQIDVNGSGRDELDPYFVSDEAFAGPGKTISEAPQQKLDVEKATWRRFAFRPGVSLPDPGAGEAAPLPEGPMIAFGFFAPKKSANHNFDTIEVKAAGLVGGAKTAGPIDVQRPAGHREKVDVSKVTGAVLDESKIVKTIEATPDTLDDAVRQTLASLAEGTATKLLLRDGVYRRRMPPMNFEAAGEKAHATLLVIEGESRDGVIFSGADVMPTGQWKAVEREGKVAYYEAPWPHDFGLRGWNNGPHDLKRDIGHRTELLVYNGRVMRPVSLERYDVILGKERGTKAQYEYKGFSDPAEALAPGTFGVAERAENGDRIFFRPPDGASLKPDDVIETAVRDTLLWVQFKENLVVRNLNFRHARNHHGAATAHIGADSPARFQLRNVLVDGVNAHWNSGLGLKVMWAQGVTVRNCDASYNGGGGITTAALQNVLWEDNQTNFNNWRGAWGGFVSWAFGGVKHHRIRDGIFRRHTAIGNHTRGFWFDIDHRNLLLEDITAVGNIRGIFLEICPGPIEVRRALLADDREVDLEIHACYDVTVEDSIIVGRSGKEGAVKIHAWKGRTSTVTEPWAAALGVPNENVVFDDPGPHRMVNNVMGSLGSYAIINLRGSNPDLLRSGYVGRGNVLFPPGGKLVTKVGPGEKTLTLAEWGSSVSDAGAVVMDSPFVDAAGFDFRLKSGAAHPAGFSKLPARRIDPRLIEQMQAFRAWVGEGAADGKEAGD